MGYTHFSYEERFYIEARLAHQDSNNAIAAALSRSPSSIGREIKTNTDPAFGFYSARQAQILSDERQSKAVRKPQKLLGVPSPNPRNFCQRKSSENRCFPYSL